MNEPRWPVSPEVLAPPLNLSADDRSSPSFFSPSPRYPLLALATLPSLTDSPSLFTISLLFSLRFSDVKNINPGRGQLWAVALESTGGKRDGLGEEDGLARFRERQKRSRIDDKNRSKFHPVFRLFVSFLLLSFLFFYTRHARPRAPFYTRLRTAFWPWVIYRHLASVDRGRKGFSKIFVVYFKDWTC